MVRRKDVCLILLIVQFADVESLVSKHHLSVRSNSPMTVPPKPNGLNGVNGLTDVHRALTLRGGDETQQESAPTPEPAKWAPSASSELHDNLNIVILTALGFSSIWALCVGEQFFGNLLTWIGSVYIGLDSLWLLVQPSIVKSPKMILGHHIATLLVLLDPLLQPSHSVYTSACLLVEVMLPRPIPHCLLI